MKQEKLNHLIILYAYKERLENLDLNEMANEFISKNDSRRLTFGKPTLSGWLLLKFDFTFLWTYIFVLHKVDFIDKKTYFE